VEPDQPFHTALASRCPFPLVREPQAFQGEHSIEFVVIWLQILRDLFFPDRSFTILPVLCGGLHDFVEKGVPPPGADPAAVFAKALSGLPGADDPDTAWVASIDGCHVGPRFRHPFDADEKMRRLVASWERHLWSVASTETLPDFFQHLSSNSNGFHFDGVGVLHTLLAGRSLKAEIQPTVHWHDPSDQSLVSFSRGHLKSVTSG
jgi:predicted class III extradiol MEMO1 family dioxygenase